MESASRSIPEARQLTLALNAFFWSSRIAIPNPPGTNNQLCGRQFSHKLGKCEKWREAVNTDETSLAHLPLTPCGYLILLAQIQVHGLGLWAPALGNPFPFPSGKQGKWTLSMQGRQPQAPTVYKASLQKQGCTFHLKFLGCMSLVHCDLVLPTRQMGT